MSGMWSPNAGGNYPHGVSSIPPTPTGSAAPGPDLRVPPQDQPMSVAQNIPLIVQRGERQRLGQLSPQEIQAEEELFELKAKLQAANHMLHTNELLITKYEDIIASALQPETLVTDAATCTSDDFSMMRNRVASSALYGVGALSSLNHDDPGAVLFQRTSTEEDYTPPIPHLMLNKLEAELRRLDRERAEEEAKYLARVDTLTAEAGRLVQLMRAVAAQHHESALEMHRRASSIKPPAAV
jgi:hypothetical protein